MIEILLKRLSSLHDLKEDVLQQLSNVKDDNRRMKFEDPSNIQDYCQIAESLVTFIDNYRERLKSFLDDYKTVIGFDIYEDHMKALDDELYSLCGRYVLLKAEMLEPATQ